MEINAESCGRISLKKHKFFTKSARKDGLCLKIHHTLFNKSPKANKIRFLHAGLNKTGTTLAASNHRGDIYIVDFNIQKFWYLDTVPSISVIKFTPKDENEFLCGEYDGTVNFLNCQSGLTGVNLRGHKNAVIDISFCKQDKCITTTGIDAIVWDLRSFKMVQVLQAEDGNVIKQAMFIPKSNYILACFQDDVIQVWKADTFDPIKQIIPSAPNKIQIKSIAFTQNGKIMVISGHTCKLIIFTIENWSIVDTITLPANIQSIKRIEFVSNAFDGGANKMLALLSSSGSMLFYDMETERVVQKLTMDNEILKFSVSQGKYLACVVNTGEVNLYKLATYTTTPGKSKEKAGLLIKSSTGCKVNKNQVKESLDLGQLRSILKEYGEYPDLYRGTIWSGLLSLPNDKRQYDRIIARTYESPFNNLEDFYPMVNKQDLRNVKRALCNIVSWCPFFAEVAYLPFFVFPFVRFFQNEPILTFETLIVIIVNYCQYWFEYHPLPPINILGIIENILIEQEPSLITHFNTINVNTTIYAWPLLQSAFSEVLPKSEWLVLWDHVLSNEPSFLLIAVVAYNVTNKHTLLSLKKKEEFEVFFHSQNTFDFKRFLAKAYALLRGVSMCLHPRQYLDVFRKPKEGFYPVFQDFPKVRFENRTDETTQIPSKDFIESSNLESIKKESEELLRLSELEKIYREKLSKEHEHAVNKQHRLHELCSKLNSKESSFVKKSPKPCIDECKMIYQNKKSTREEVNEIERELLEHYKVLLKHKLQINNLNGDGDRFDYGQLKVDYDDLTKEIKKAKKLANDTQYLKELNIKTSLDAVTKLIDKVESQLQMDNADSSTQVNVLVMETKELSDDLSKLINLITRMK